MKSVDDYPELFQEAVDAWIKWTTREGGVPQQPGRYDSEIGRKYVYLRNVNGLLARYDIKKKKIVE